MAKAKKPSAWKNPVVLLLILVILAGGTAAGLSYWHLLQSRVSIEKSQIVAPTIALAPTSTSVIERVFVREGDTVHKNQIVAIVGNTSLQAKTDGIVTSVSNTPGALASTTAPVVRMIDPRELRVVGRIEEDKGLADLRVGQRVIFTVDAFGSREYYGTIESISPTSREQDIVFSISDKREEKEFDVKASFDLEQYPELKNGMSARMWVYK